MKSRVIDIRGADEALHATLAEWWTAHGWAPVPVTVLPRCGVVIDNDEGTPIAATFLYMENSGVGVAWMEWTVTNPALSPMKSYAAIVMLTQAIREVALSLDYGIVMTTAKQAGLVKAYERNGFKTTDTGMTHMIMATR